MYATFAKVIEHAKAQMTAGQRSDLERALRYHRGDLAKLEKLIGAEAKLPQLASKREALEEAKTALKQHQTTCPKRSGSQSFLNAVGVILLILGVIVFAPSVMGFLISAAEPYHSYREEIMGTFAGGVLILMGGTFRMISSVRRELEKYQAKLTELQSREKSSTAAVEELEAELARVDLEALRGKFGKEKSLEEYRQMLDDCRAWLESFAGQYAYPPPPEPAVGGYGRREDGVWA